MIKTSRLKRAAKIRAYTEYAQGYIANNLLQTKLEISK